MNRTRVILVAIVVIGVLGGCAPRDSETTSPPVAEVAAETPSPTPEPTKPAVSELVLSTEGLDYLVIGQPIPDITDERAIVAWDETYCANGVPPGEPFAGAWMPTYSEEFAFVLDDTRGGVRDGALMSILVPRPGVATAEGIRVGSTRAELEASYPAFDERIAHPEYELLVLNGTAGQLIFDMDDDVVAAMQVTPVDSDPQSSRGGDASFACV